LKGRKERYLSADISAKCRYSGTGQDLNNLSGTVINPEMVLAQAEKCHKIDNRESLLSFQDVQKAWAPFFSVVPNFSFRHKSFSLPKKDLGASSQQTLEVPPRPPRQGARILQNPQQGLNTDLLVPVKPLQKFKQGKFYRGPHC